MELDPVRQSFYAPQWSPPLIGGNTLPDRGLPRGEGEPQWSPPLIGGNTRSSRTTYRTRQSGRNGARR